MSLQVNINKHVLSKKQEEVLARLATGKTYEEVAQELHRDIQTIRSHSVAIREIMHAKSMLEAVAKAVARGIITITENGGKTLLLALIMVGSGIPENHEAGKIKIKTRIKIERRINEL